MCLEIEVLRKILIKSEKLAENFYSGDGCFRENQR